MIVLAKMKSNDGKKVFKKCLIRDRTFIEVDDECRKVSNGVVKASDVDGVISLQGGKFQVVKTNDWLDEAQNKNFWGS